MSRPPRVLSKTGLYHIYFRGINRQNLFEEKSDYQKFLCIINDQKTESEFKLYAYCLMDNHVHLFIREKEAGDIKKIMHSILTKYVGWFNYKYDRKGVLISNRYKSEPIENESYCLNLIRYIHQNPLNAGIVDKLEDYLWSSYTEYLQENRASLIDTEMLFDMLGVASTQLSDAFVEFHNIVEEIDFTISESKKLTTAQMNRKIFNILGISADKIIELPKSERHELVLELRKNGFKNRQLERLTGISRGILDRIK